MSRRALALGLSLTALAALLGVTAADRARAQETPPVAGVIFIANYTPYLGALDKAVTAWNRNGLVELRQVTSCATVYDRPAPCVTIVPSEWIEWRGIDNVLGLTTPTGPDRWEIEVNRGLIRALAGDLFTWRNYFARSVLCHELGHVLFAHAGADWTAHKPTGCMRDGLATGEDSYRWVTAPVHADLLAALTARGVTP
jgi:hypothetical protein